FVMGFELSWSLIAALHGNKHCIDCAHDARRALTGYAFAVFYFNLAFGWQNYLLSKMTYYSVGKQNDGRSAKPQCSRQFVRLKKKPPPFEIAFVMQRLNSIYLVF
ncbi:hypothetical protein, partial [Acetomicrobium sp. S15 = DSM 107314]|uniref:hypothetical protein n=1 Tax=Acetomicrobium sp. S15 = DSM 107314 TaxID=2529858 RepID=UPI001E55FD86